MSNDRSLTGEMQLGHKLCLGCGYILDYLLENRCPECGLCFDPDDVSSFGPRENIARMWSKSTSFLLAAVVTIAVLPFSGYSYPWVSLTAILMDGFVVSAGSILVVKHRCRHRPMMVLAVVLAGLSIFQTICIPRLY